MKTIDGGKIAVAFEMVLRLDDPNKQTNCYNLHFQAKSIFVCRYLNYAYSRVS